MGDVNSTRVKCCWCKGVLYLFGIWAPEIKRTQELFLTSTSEWECVCIVTNPWSQLCWMLQGLDLARRAWVELLLLLLLLELDEVEVEVVVAVVVVKHHILLRVTRSVVGEVFFFAAEMRRASEAFLTSTTTLVCECARAQYPTRGRSFIGCCRPWILLGPVQGLIDLLASKTAFELPSPPPSLSSFFPSSNSS